MKTLHLTLKKKWFDMILSGEKKEEYRQIKPYWIKRLTYSQILSMPFTGSVEIAHWHNVLPKNIDIIHFTNGYGKNLPQVIIECKGISVESNGNSSWGFEDRCFVIKLGKIIETKNVNH